MVKYASHESKNMGSIPVGFKMLLSLILCILCITINIILVGGLFKIKQDLVRSISLISSIVCFFLSLFF